MSNRGFIRSIVAIVIALAIAAYFGFDLREYLSQEQATEFVLKAWENVLQPVILFFWGIAEKIVDFVT
ncbi:MAG: hypothetical protein WDZ70_02095 [Candidatus Paceibacterota bacterium]